MSIVSTILDVGKLQLVCSVHFYATTCCCFVFGYGTWKPILVMELEKHQKFLWILSNRRTQMTAICPPFSQLKPTRVFVARANCKWNCDWFGVEISIDDDCNGECMERVEEETDGDSSPTFVVFSIWLRYSHSSPYNEFD